MRFELQNVVAIREADIEVGPVAGGKGPGISLITGPNESGKTVLRNAMAAALTGTYGIYGATKDRAAALVMDGAEFAVARVIFDEDYDPGNEVAEGIQVTWPNCHVKLKGSPETADKISVGWDTPLTLAGKEWKAWLFRLAGIDADTVSDEVAGEVRAAVNRIAPWGDVVIKKISGLGWDSAAAEYGAAAQAERGRWAKLTGQRWGSNLLNLDKMLWTHLDFDPGLELAAAEAELAKLKEELAPALAQSRPIPPEERNRLRNLAGNYDGLAREHTRHVSELQEIDHQIAETGTVYQHACKNCGFDQLLKLVGGKLVDEDDEAEVDVDALRERRQKLSAEADRIMTEMGEAVQAKVRIEQLDTTVAKAGVDIGRIKARIEQLEPKVIAAQTTKEAKELAGQAIALQRVAEFLAPGGYRREMLIAALGDAKDPASIQGRLVAMTETMFNGPEVHINTGHEDMPCLLGGHLDWHDLTWGGDASSSMLRVRAALQMLHAERVGAPCVLVDMVDTLQGPVRQAFVKAIVKHVRVPVVLFCALAGEPPAEDPLAKAGLGRTYVIGADGVVRGVNQGA